ncbi:hypothetical protein D3C72_866900 [compost metagenome]
MHFRVIGQLVVDDGAQLLDVEATGCHVGRDQDGGAAVGEAYQHLIPFPLFQIAVQRQGREALGGQVIGHVVAGALGVAEHHAGARLIVAQQPGEGVEALTGRHFIQLLFDCAALVQGLHAHLDRVALHTAAHLGYPLRVGGGEQQGLAALGRIADDAVDVFAKAHVQHAIRFVQHQGLQAGEFQGALLQVLENAARSADGDVGTEAQGGRLRCGRGAATQGHQLDVRQGAGQTTDLLGHLIRQLAGRTEHQGLYVDTVDVEAGEQAEGEGGGLAAAGFCLGNQVFAFEYQRQALSLDRGHLQIAQAGEVLLQGGGEIEAAKFAVVHKRTLFRRKRGCASAKAAHHTRMWHRMWRIFERLSPYNLRAGSSVPMATERCNRGGTW